MSTLTKCGATRLCGLALVLLCSCRDGCEEPRRTQTRDAGTHQTVTRDGAESTSPTPSHAPGPWRATVMPVFAQGPLPAAGIEETIRSHVRALDACARNAPLPDLDRIRVMLRLSIGADGNVFEVTPVQPRPEAQSLRGCVTTLIRAWNFPRSDAAASQALVALEFTPEAM